MGTLDRIISNAARKHGVSENYLRKLIEYESKGDPRAVSPTGAKGLTQFTKGTAREMGLKNRADPEANVDAAARLAKKNEQTFIKIMGRPPKEDELYLTHLQGRTGATTGLQNPNALAVDVFGADKVRVNLPKNQRGRLNSITVQEYNDLHRGGFNKSGGGKADFSVEKPTPTGTIDITDQPTLKNLNPPKPPSSKGDKQSTIPLSQLAPTEASTMARSKYPGYDEAIKQAMAEGTENVQMAPSAFIPKATDIRGRPTAPNIRGSVQLAGAIPASVTKVPKTKKVKSPENEAARKRAEEEHGQMPKGDGPYNRTDPSTRGMEGTYEDYVIKERARIAGEAKRAKELKDVPSAEKQIERGVGSSADIVPKRVRTVPIGPPAALGAAGVGAAAVGDPAVEAVQRAIGGAPSIDDTGGAGQPQQPVGPQPVTPNRPTSRAPELSPNDVVGKIFQQAAPVMQEVIRDPQAGPAVQTVLKKAAEVKARRDAMAADQQNDPTYYQMMASRGQMPGGAQDDRAMERAVMMDNARRGAPSARGMPTASAPAAMRRPLPPPKSQARVPSTEEQIVAQAIPPRDDVSVRIDPNNPPRMTIRPETIPPGAERGEVAPQAGPAVQPMPYSPVPEGGVRTPGMSDPTGGVAGYPQRGIVGPGMTPQPQMDPVMQMLMQFYTQGGSTGGGVMP